MTTLNITITRNGSLDWKLTFINRLKLEAIRMPFYAAYARYVLKYRRLPDLR